MKSIFLFLGLIVCSYCTKMTYVGRNLKNSLPTTSSENKYFFLTNSYFYKYSNYIYFYLEDEGFGLSYNNIKYCRANTNPYYTPDDVVSGCSFSTIPYYSNESSSSSTKYYYKFSTSSSYTYSIIYYAADYSSSGNLYVFCNYDELVIKMTSVSRNSRKSLPITNIGNKYFYMQNYDYYKYSSYVYFYLEDNGFGLNYNNIKFSGMGTSPDYDPYRAVSGASFNNLSFYRNQSYSGITKYYYKFYVSILNSYAFVYYEGSNNSGNLYAYWDYYDIVVKMTQVSRNSTTSLPLTSTRDKYFYITNSDYYPHSSYVYFYLYYYNFFFNFNNITYCLTNTNPYYYPDDAVIGCSFTTLPYYSYENYTSSYKYYYKFSISSSYNYSIIYYSGGYSSYGNLYAYSSYNELVIKMTSVPINLRKSLPITNVGDKYFYIENSDYYNNLSDYVYFYLEDNDFGLSYNNIKYCLTDTNPDYDHYYAISGCSFSNLPYYDPIYNSGSSIYHYKFSSRSSYTYSIVYYEGSNSSGNLYVYCYYKSTSNEDLEVLSVGAIVGIVLGSIIFLVIFVIILKIFRNRLRNNKTNSITQPNYVAPNSYVYPSNQPNIIPDVNSPDISLKLLPTSNQDNLFI